MSNKNIRKFKQEYSGKCTIIPCPDLVKFGEDSFWELKNDIIEAVAEQRIICDWNIKEEYLKNIDEFDDDSKEEFWNEIVCDVFSDGFLVIYEYPVPSNVHKENGRLSHWSFDGWTGTNYIHLKDISQLYAVLSNIDDDIVEEVWKEEQEKKSEKAETENEE